MHTKPTNRHALREKFIRAGIATKGMVYCLAGLLTTFSALNLSGGQKADTRDSLRFVAGQPFGSVLILLMGVGLLGFAFWRLYQAIDDPESNDASKKRMATRVGYGISGLFYGFLAYYAFRLLAGSVNTGSGGTSQKDLVAGLLSAPGGPLLVGLVAVIFFGKAIHQFYKAYSGKFADKVRDGALAGRTRRLLRTAGKIGYAARGVVVGIVGYLLLRAALEAKPDQAGGTDDAFAFIEGRFGPLVLAVVALGLVGYGAFLFVKARYRDLSAV